MVFEGHPFRDAPMRKLPSARIKPHVSRFAKFIGVAVVAVIWNVICGWQLVSAVKLGPGSAIAFVSFFALVGLVLLGSAVHAFLGMFNPTVEVLVAEDQPVLGEALELRWRLAGKSSRVQRLQIALEGIEEATSIRGDDTRIERQRFMNVAIAAATDPDEIADGTATILIPRDSVPSFSAKHNKIVWRLLVQGEIANWPDIDEEFIVDVVAHRRVRAKAAA